MGNSVVRNKKEGTRLCEERSSLNFNLLYAGNELLHSQRLLRRSSSQRRGKLFNLHKYHKKRSLLKSSSIKCFAQFLNMRLYFFIQH